MPLLHAGLADEVRLRSGHVGCAEIVPMFRRTDDSGTGRGTGAGTNQGRSRVDLPSLHVKRRAGILLSSRSPDRSELDSAPRRSGVETFQRIHEPGNLFTPF